MNKTYTSSEQQVHTPLSIILTNIINFFLLAVEDKLQERVPETIRDLLLARIKVWMLTGVYINILIIIIIIIII